MTLMSTIDQPLGFTRVVSHAAILHAPHHARSWASLNQLGVALVFYSFRLLDLLRFSCHCRNQAQLRVLRLFGNPLEYFPEIIPCRSLRHLSLANVTIKSDPDLRSVDVSISMVHPAPHILCRGWQLCLVLVLEHTWSPPDSRSVYTARVITTFSHIVFTC